MKKLLIAVTLISFLALPAFSQSVLDQAKTAGQVLEVLPISDVSGTANKLLGLLKPKLALSDPQGPKVTGLLTDFLTAKSGILSLAKSNPTEYTSKFTGIKDKLFNGLKTVLSAAQYTKLLGLKPKTSSASNLLSHLFF